MDSSPLGRIISKIAIAILVIALVDLVYINWWIFQSQESRAKSQEDRLASQVSQPTTEPTLSPTSSPTSQPKVETPNQNKYGSGQASTQTIVQTAQKEIFIPIGSGSTKNNNYEDLAGLEVTIDTGKYPNIESAVFEASIWVQDGNGKMFAQLFNSSDKHPVWSSEISTNSAKGVLSTSGKITLDKGSKTYQVQAKTNLTAYAAHVENARIKITLK